MLEYNLDIGDQSVWVIATQNTVAKSMPFYITEIGSFISGPDYYTKRSNRDGYYLLYTKSGCGFLQTPQESVELPPQHALLVDCGPPHHYRSFSTDLWINYWIHLDGATMDVYGSRLWPGRVALTQPDAFEATFHQLLHAAQQEDIAASAQVSHLVSTLLTQMLVDHLTLGGDQRALHHQGIESAVRYIRKNYQHVITIDDMIKDINISKFHFVRLFNRYMGTTPYNYLIHYRINQAKRLLCSSDLPIGEIAAQTGYLSESNFIHQFQKLSGLTPVQFRKNNLNYF